MLAAASLAGTLAWAGHGTGGAGLPGSIHLAADFLHLIAAAAWVGGLLPLAMMLTAAGKASSFGVARAASLRFSAYGIAAVGTLLLPVRSILGISRAVSQALTATDYGHLLLVKIALFLVMVALATVNRLRLTPRLVEAAGTRGMQDASRQLMVMSRSKSPPASLSSPSSARWA